MSSELADRLAVQDVMLRYAAGVDELNFELYASCFADDVEVVGMGSETVHGKDNWVTYVQGALNAYESTQHMLSPVMAIVQDDIARARTDVQATHFLKEPQGARLTLWATYLSDMQRIDGQWKITRHELVRRGMHQE